MEVACPNQLRDAAAIQVVGKLLACGFHNDNHTIDMGRQSLELRSNGKDGRDGTNDVRSTIVLENWMEQDTRWFAETIFHERVDVTIVNFSQGRTAVEEHVLERPFTVDFVVEIVHEMVVVVLLWGDLPSGQVIVTSLLLVMRNAICHAEDTILNGPAGVGQQISRLVEYLAAAATKKAEEASPTAAATKNAFIRGISHTLPDTRSLLDSWYPRVGSGPIDNLVAGVLTAVLGGRIGLPRGPVLAHHERSERNALCASVGSQ
mmetsp:Transcript_17591/g.50337  ORF Transcript_17591/g.50337 Transcript_17591/m.50337 type:complete len:262 (-) Transcript_17591:29-814(-)